MGIHVEYVAFKPKEESKIELSELYHTSINKNTIKVGKLGCLIQAAFRGTKKDIEQVIEIIGNKKYKKVNEFVYELYISPASAKDKNLVFDVIEKVPNCKVAIYLCNKWYSQTIGSESGYPFITYKPSRPNYHKKEDEAPWYDGVDPKCAGISWDELNYVVEIENKKMKMTNRIRKGDVEVTFIDGGAKITKIYPKKNIVTIPKNIKGEPIIEVDEKVFNKQGLEIRSPYISINEWPDKNTRKSLVLGYARGIYEGLEFDHEVIQKNNKYIKSQRKKLFDLAVVDKQLLMLMFKEKMLTDEDIKSLIEKVKELENEEFLNIILENSETKFKD